MPFSRRRAIFGAQSLRASRLAVSNDRGRHCCGSQACLTLYVSHLGNVLFGLDRVVGDTDTVAACAGGPAGELVGLNGIEGSRPDAPAMLRLLKDATQPGKLDLGGLKRLAGQLHAAVGSVAEAPVNVVEEARL